MKSRDCLCVFCLLKLLVRRRYMVEEELRIKPEIPRVGPEGGRVPPEVESAIQRARGGGQPLEDELKEQMSTSLGHDFSEVRIHTGPGADELNRQLSARAFTIGTDIFFSQGTYAPASISGRKLIAHELVHVVQQSDARDGGCRSGITVSPTDDIFEREADAQASIASAPVSGLHIAPIAIRHRTKRPSVIQRNKLSIVCHVPAPANRKLTSVCHVATLWWIYKARHISQGYSDFLTALGIQNPSQLISQLLLTKQVRKRSKWGLGSRPLQVSDGAVVVFSDGKAFADVNQGHSCVCGGGNTLYGHNQSQGAFTNCTDGGRGGHCDHPTSEINWTSKSEVADKWYVYTIEANQATNWAAGVNL